jgi:glycosyltransferase involved in cell wall biosynthesis
VGGTLRICFVTHSAHGLLATWSGGSERQVALLAREMACRGHEVCVVVPGLTSTPGSVDGVRLLSGWDPHRGVRWVRALYRYPNLHRVLADQRADVYYTRGGAFFTPTVVQTARRAGRVSLLALASDKDLYPSSGRVLFAVRNPYASRVIGRFAYAGFRRLAVRAATCVLVQNQQQAESCRALGLPHRVVPNIVPLPPVELLARRKRRDILWAGNVYHDRRSKGLEELVGLVRMLPDVLFTVAGELRSERHRESIDALAGLPNVVLTGLLSRDETLSLMAEHRLVINTSPSEGFSNVMLEGWALGKPSVTLWVDPNGLLSSGSLGLCADGDLETMAAQVEALLEEDEALASMAARCREYVAQVHAPQRVGDEFERLSSEMLGCRRDGIMAIRDG